MQPIVAFLDKLSYFGEQLVIKLHQCAKDKNLNEANNNGMVTPPNPNPVSALYNGFKRGYLQAKNLFTVSEGGFPITQLFGIPPIYKAFVACILGTGT